MPQATCKSIQVKLNAMLFCGTLERFGPKSLKLTITTMQAPMQASTPIVRESRLPAMLGSLYAVAM